jgi:putative inorganic carbon (hco3(-)) transporter
VTVLAGDRLHVDWAAPAARRLSGPELATLSFFLIFYTNAAVVVSRFHGVPYTIAAAFALLLVIPLATFLVIKREPLVVTPSLPYVFAFLAAVAVAAAFSSNPATARHFFSMYLSEGLLLFLLVLNAVRTPQMLHRIAWVLIVAGSILGALSVLQEATHTYGNDYGGFAQVDRVDTGGGFNTGDNALGQKNLRPRLGGPIGSENRYAQIMVVLLPLAVLRAWRERRLRRRIFAGAASLLILAGILLTFSRGAAVALALVFLAMLAFGVLPVRRFVVVLAAATAVVFVFVPDYVVRLNSLQGVKSLESSQPGQVDSALRGRQTENLAAFNTFLDHPIIGVGPGVYFTEYSQRYANELNLRYLASERRAHSLYLETAADTGALGLLAFLAMVGATLYHLRRAATHWRRRRPDHALLADSFFFALLGYLGTALFLHLSYQRYFWVVLALANCVIWAAGRDARRAADATPLTAAAAGSRGSATAPRTG